MSDKKRKEIKRLAEKICLYGHKEEDVYYLALLADFEALEKSIEGE